MAIIFFVVYITKICMVPYVFHDQFTTHAIFDTTRDNFPPQVIPRVYYSINFPIKLYELVGANCVRPRLSVSLIFGL